MKFGRIYRLNVQVSDANQSFAVVGGQVVPVQGQGSVSTNPAAVNIAYPLTLYLDVQRSTLAQASTGYFKIMNLKEDTRRQIFHDRYDTLTRRQIILSAGYETDAGVSNTANPRLPIIFQGDVRFAQSYRQKQDWVTEIEAFDGGFGIINGQVSASIPTGYQMRSVLEAVARTIPNVAMGAIGDVAPPDQNSRGIAVMGNSWEVLNDLAPDVNVFIDNGRVNIIGKDEYIETDSDPFIISADTGLLETPRRGKDTLELKLMFEPRIFVGQQVQVLSSLPYYNGLYSVQGVSHQGVISGAVNGELTTRVTVFTGSQALKGVTPITAFNPQVSA